MTYSCTLGNLVSYFTCAQQAAPMGELLTIVVFAATYFSVASYPLREALPPSLFVASLVALSLLGVGAINSTFATAAVILFALSLAYLYFGNDSNT